MELGDRILKESAIAIAKLRERGLFSELEDDVIEQAEKLIEEYSEQSNQEGEK